jgi:3'(2'), 5'-bisphosphate nucleotidase
MSLLNLLDIAVEAAIDAGAEIMKIYETDDFDVDFKSDDSPLTKADTASHKVICKYLEGTDIPILSEEGRSIPFEERKEWNQLWIVDPIDGTKEFIKKNGEFTVNIALVENGTPIMGVIYVPAKNELYLGALDMGSYKHENIEEYSDLDSIIKESVKIPVKDTNRPYTVVASRSHMSKETEDYIKELGDKYGEIETISKGSSLKLCMVAEGKADAYPRFAPTMEWDTAAGQAICMHAGFDVIDWETKETMNYNRENLLNNWFLVK